MKSDDKNSWALSWGILGAAGFQLAATVVLGIFLGSRADQEFNSSPIGLVFGLILGGTIGLINLLKLLKYRDKITGDLS